MPPAAAHPARRSFNPHRSTHRRTHPNSRCAAIEATPDTGVERGATAPLGGRLVERRTPCGALHTTTTDFAAAEVHRFDYDTDGLLRSVNEDVKDLCQKTEDYKKKNPGKVITYERK